MSQRLSGLNPLAYMGVEPITPPLFVVFPRSPTTNDNQIFNLGAIWLEANTENIWMLTSLTGGIAIWTPFGANATSIHTIVTDAGNVTPVAGVVNILGGANMNTSGSGNTELINLNTSITQPVTSADQLQGMYSLGAETFMHDYGTDNTFLGGSAGNTTLTTVSATRNTGIGSFSLTNLTTGTENSALGAFSGDTYTTESSNITIGNIGTAADANTIRIGTQGGGAGQQNLAFMAGITGVTVANQNFVTINTATGQLGATATVTTTATKITTYSTPGTFTWTKDANTKFVTAIVFGAGSGGGSGRRGASTAAGGGQGGAQGASAYVALPSSFLGATATVVVGAGGVGGVAQTVNNTNGNTGTKGGASAFSNCTLPQPTTSGVGGNTLADTGVIAGGYQGGIYGSQGNNVTLNGNGTITAGIDGAGPSAGVFMTPATGGGGAGADSVTERKGGDGGNIFLDAATSFDLIVVGGEGGLESMVIDGGDGADRTDPGAVFTGGAGGGGGGGQHTGGVAGKGGNGGFPGGGGGGGGGSLNGTNSGAGGNGAGGQVIIIEQF